MNPPPKTERELIPVVVQDADSGRVLMLAYADAAALDATRRTGEAHFWSRSRGELWRKGATSGNTMRVRQVRFDCDRDALLYVVEPAGPACHTGAASCFSSPGDPCPAGFARLERLWATISTRAAERPEGSYTVRLLDAGVEGPARKVAEEAVEVVLAAKDHAAGDGGARRVAEEAADLVYHLLVLLAERSIDPRLVLEVLDERAR
jgi:phosphoribosyl-ATP pyrophosphohydrolase/phosphoribosyl-AMP cyclohydrolase